MKQLAGPELMAMARTAGVPAPLLLDVREPWEVAIAAIRIEGLPSVSMPMNSVPAACGELDPARPVVCICHHGARSAQVVAYLERQGFDLAYNLAGGIDAWSLQVDPSVPRY